MASKRETCAEKGGHVQLHNFAQLLKSVPWAWNIPSHGDKKSSQSILVLLPCLGVCFPVLGLTQEAHLIQ